MNFPIIQQHQDLQQAVSARELQGFLEVKDRFSVWIERMIGYGFVENQDFIGCSFYDTLARQHLRDYFISIDMAKEISMIQRSDKGKQARQYFLECERKMQHPALPDFTNPADAAIAWAEQYRAKEAAQAQVIELQPKADALARISRSEGSLGIREAAKAAGMKQNDFVAWCIDTDKPISARFMYRDYSGALNAYSHRIEQGLITQKMNSFVGNDGRDRVAPQVRFTPAGIAKIAELIQKSKRKELAIA